MWSDRPDASELDQIVRRLRELLPPAVPRPFVRRAASGLGKAAPFEVVAPLAEAAGTCWLDDAGGDALVAVGPALTITSCRGRTWAARGDRRVELQCGGLDAIAAVTRAYRASMPRARLVGFLGYELAAEIESFEPFPRADLGLPDLWLSLYDTWLSASDAGWELEGYGAWCDPEIDGGTVATPGAAASAPEPRRPRHGMAPTGSEASSTMACSPDDATFRDAVRRTVARIRGGEIFQSNLCRRLEAPLADDHQWQLWRRLREISPARYGAFLRPAPGQAVLSISPECFLRVRGGRAESRPIKGTRRREGAKGDAERAAELLASEKDRAELAMIVDVARNDLGRVAAPGTVEVVEHAALMILPTLLHTVSTVRARLREDVDPADVLRACFPPASITGAPKIQAIRVARSEEPYARGPAMGAIGWIALDGDMELSVAIRTAAAAAGRVAYHAGCGIVAESDPDEELQESQSKAAAFVRAMGHA